MSTENDPFASTPDQPAPQQPGMLSGSVPPPPAYPAAPTAYAAPVMPTRPANVLALLAIVTTGAYTALSVVNALLSPASVQRAKDQLGDPDSVSATTSLGETALSLLSLVAMIASYVFLALWMSRIRANLAALGSPAGGPPAVEWWGWFVPLANFVLPFLGMRAITRRSVGLGTLLGWWLPFCAMWLVFPISATATVRAIDLESGKVTDASALDQTVPLAWTTTLLLVVSWLFLTAIIRRATARHAETTA